MTRRLRPQTLTAAAAAAVLSLALSACGGPDSSSEGSDGSDSGSAAPSQAELEAFQDQAGTDAASVADAVVAAYQSGGSYPESADGLGTLTDGNELGAYETDGTTAELCVEHVVDGEAVAFVSWYVDASAEPARSSELSKGLNAGCS